MKLPLKSQDGMTLLTKKKYCGENIDIIPELQVKEVSFLPEDQSITPDPGYAGLKEVKVEAIPDFDKYARTDIENEFTAPQIFNSAIVLSDPASDYDVTRKIDLDNKRDRITPDGTYTRVYSQNKDGTESSIIASTTATPQKGTIPLRNDNGNIVGYTATGNTEYTPLSQVNAIANKKLDKITSTLERAYIASNNQQSSLPIVSTGITAYSLPKRDVKGNFYVGNVTSNDNEQYAANIKYVKDNTVSSKGGTVDGNLAITGNLTVSGTTTTEKEEQLLVKANVIATNADKTDLKTLLSGLAINKNADATYGIMYDPVDDTVKFGEGTLDADNKFVFKDGEGHPLAIRADSAKFTDAHLVRWDADTKSFVDAGLALEGGSADASIQQPPVQENFINTIVGYVRNSTDEYPAGKEAYGAYVDPSIYNSDDGTTEVKNEGERTTLLGGLSASFHAEPTKVRKGWYGDGSQSFIHGKRIVNVGDQNHILGTDHIVYGDNNFVAGLRNVATNGEVTMLGTGLIANRLWQVILGRYNKPSHSFFQIGGGKQVQHIDGTNPDGSNKYVLDSIERKNVLEIDEGGNAILLGRLTIGIEPASENDAVRKKELDEGLATKVNILPVPASGSILYGVSSSSTTGQPQAYSTGTKLIRQYVIPQRDEGGQINLPDQITNKPGPDQAISRSYADASYPSQEQFTEELSKKYIIPIDKTSSEWASDTQIIAKGQLAINRLANGRVQLRVGTGTKKFTALKPVAEWNIVEDDLGFGTFETAMEVRVTSEELDTIEYYCPDSPENDFYAALTFSTGNTAPEFTPDERCKFTGTHCTNGKFTPKANMHYNVYYWYDGTIQAVVRGVPTDDAAYPSTGGATIGAIDNANPPALEKVVYCAESEIPENPSEGVEYACTDFIKKEDLDIDLQAEIDGKQAKLTFDTAPTASSTNPVTSAGIYNAIANFMTIQVSDSLIGG